MLENTFDSAFSKQIAQAVATHDITIRPDLLQTIIAGTVGQLLQEIEDRKAAAAAGRSPSIMECAADYIADRSTTGHCTSKTGKENLAIIKVLTQIIGDKAIDEVTAQDVVTFRQTILQLPPNMHKAPKFRTMTIGQILQAKPAKVLSLRSVNKYLSRVSSFFTWCRRKGLIAINPFEGSAIVVKKGQPPKRQVFSEADLQRLFSPQLVQLHDEGSWRFYIMLLALATGARLEEICQLHCSDIVIIDGITCLDINDDGETKQLKNQSSRRIIPVHPVLIRLGFQEFVEQQSRLGTSLFPCLKKIAGSYGHSYSQWFRRYRELCGVGDPTKTFHSFRHTVATWLKDLDVPVYVAAEVLGHTVPGMTYGHYGKTTGAKKMLLVIEQLHLAKILAPLLL